MPPQIVVIKLGTSSICDERTHHVRLGVLSQVVETVMQLRNAGHAVVLVSSGAIGVGMQRMELSQRPDDLAQKQALAAVGQGRLMSIYDTLFSLFHQPIAQILLTRQDLADEGRYQNAKNTVAALLAAGVVPIVNENDTEIKFGDNDTLSAITAALIQADWLFVVTDVPCLYTDNPRTNADAQPIHFVDDIDALMANIKVSSPGSHLGTGGMITKIIAARLATAAGVKMVITAAASMGAAMVELVEASDARAHAHSHGSTFFAPSANPLRTHQTYYAFVEHFSHGGQ